MAEHKLWPLWVAIEEQGVELYEDLAARAPTEEGRALCRMLAARKRRHVGVWWQAAARQGEAEGESPERLLRGVGSPETVQESLERWRLDLQNLRASVAEGSVGTDVALLWAKGILVRSALRAVFFRLASWREAVSYETQLRSVLVFLRRQPGGGGGEADRRVSQMLVWALWEETKRVWAADDHAGALVPICSHCKLIRTDDGRWVGADEYFRDRLGVVFTHGLCQDCAEVLYPGVGKRKAGGSAA